MHTYRFELPDLDLTTYFGRIKHLFRVLNPVLLLTTNKQIKEANHILERERQGDDSLSRKQVHRARTVAEAVAHPQTKEKIPAMFRMSSFIPATVPLVMGITMSTTPVGTTFWHWLNQSYIVCVNMANGNKTNRPDQTKLAAAYTIAVGSACGVSWWGSKKSSHSPTRFLTKPMIAYLALGTAHVLNISVMRSNEISHGINLTDENGNVVGKSKVAGGLAVGQSALTRILLPIPILFLPPMILNKLEQSRLWARSTMLRSHRLSIQMAVLTGVTWFSLPIVCGLFPQECRVHSDVLEEEFHGKKTYYWYHRGL